MTPAAPISTTAISGGPNLVPSPASAVPWHALLPGVLLDLRDWATLDGMVRLRTFHQGAALMRHGEAATALLAVCAGTAGAAPRRPSQEDGRAPGSGVPFRPKWTFHGPQWLDVHTAFLEERYEQDAVVLSPTLQLMEWPMRRARDWLRRTPAVQEALSRVLSAQLREAHGAVSDLVSKDANSRVAGWLLDQAGTGSRLRLAERKRDVAAQLALSPETFSRVLRLLGERQLTRISGYTVDLLDRDGLAALAGRI